MRGLCVLALVLASCVSPAPTHESAPVAPQIISHVVPLDEREDLDQLTVRLDLLRSLRSDLESKVRDDSRDAQRTWNASLRDFDDRVLEFVAGHPELHPDSVQRLEERVLDPLEALRHAPDLDETRRPQRR